MDKLTMRAARVNAGLTQEEAAREIGVKANTIGKWERNEVIPSVQNFAAACKLYGYYMDDIFLPSKTH